MLLTLVWSGLVVVSSFEWTLSLVLVRASTNAWNQKVDGLVELCTFFFIGCWMGLVRGRLLWGLIHDILYLVLV